MEQLNPCPNGVASCTPTLQPRPAQVRRGARVAEFERVYWRCSRCRDPLTGEPLEVADAAVSARNEHAAGEAWRAKFGEELPRAIPPGRKPGNPREQRVTVLLTEDELAVLDRQRGKRSRSDFIREAVLTRRRAG